MEHVFLRCHLSGFTFLDEFRLIASNGRLERIEGKRGLVVFDTSLPPGSWRRFSITPPHLQYDINLSSVASIHTDSNGSWGEGSCDGPFIVDPTQSVVVIFLDSYRDRGLHAWSKVFVIRAAALVGYMSSTPTGQRIPWDRWKRDVMIVDIPDRNAIHIRTLVLGTRLLVMRRNRRGKHHVYAHDFSRWGCRALVCVGGGVKRKKRVLPDPEKIWSPGESYMESLELRVVGDCLATCSVGD